MTVKSAGVSGTRSTPYPFGVSGKLAKKRILAKKKRAMTKLSTAANIGYEAHIWHMADALLQAHEDSGCHASGNS